MSQPASVFDDDNDDGDGMCAARCICYVRVETRAVYNNSSIGILLLCFELCVGASVRGKNNQFYCCLSVCVGLIVRFSATAAVVERASYVPSRMCSRAAACVD